MGKTNGGFVELGPCHRMGGNQVNNLLSYLNWFCCESCRAYWPGGFLWFSICNFVCLINYSVKKNKKQNTKLTVLKLLVKWGYNSTAFHVSNHNLEFMSKRLEYILVWVQLCKPSSLTILFANIIQNSTFPPNKLEWNVNCQ